LRLRSSRHPLAEATAGNYVFVVVITRRVRITPRAAGAGDSADTVLSTMWSMGATWTAT
jgi:hypothetical protein